MFGKKIGSKIINRIKFEYLESQYFKKFRNLNVQIKSNMDQLDILFDKLYPIAQKAGIIGHSLYEIDLFEMGLMGKAKEYRDRKELEEMCW